MIASQGLIGYSTQTLGCRAFRRGSYMKVIGAGFGRTGTLSLQSALELLGFKKCYHMAEVFQHPEHVPIWQDAADGKPVQWDQLFQGYEATVDWPGCTFYRELMQLYPDAKVLLSVRDFERWYISASETIYPITQQFPTRLVGPLIPRMGRQIRMVNTLVWQNTFKGRFQERGYAREVFEAHIAEVKRVVPPERLLVYDVRQGWEPLCRFLNVPVPQGVNFPHLNDSEAFKRRIRAVQAFSYFCLLVALSGLGLLLYWLLG